MADDGSARWMPAFLALLRTHARLWDRVEADVRQISGLTLARYDVLMHLDLAGGRLGLNALAQAVVLSPSGLSKLLSRMERSGLVERRPDPDDARAAFATITGYGRDLVRKTRRKHHPFLQQIFGDALDDRELATLIRIMEKIHAQTQP